MEPVLKGSRVHLIDFLGRKLIEALVFAPNGRVRHAGEILHLHDVVCVGHDRHRLDEGRQIKAQLVAEVPRLLQAVEVVDYVWVNGVDQKRVLSYGPPTGVDIERSDNPGFCAFSCRSHVELDQPLAFEFQEHVEALDDRRAVKVGAILDV